MRTVGVQGRWLALSLAVAVILSLFQPLIITPIHLDSVAQAATTIHAYSTDRPYLKLNTTNQLSSDIFIMETAPGQLTSGTSVRLSIEDPGTTNAVRFASLPVISVDSGDISISSVSLNDNVVSFHIDAISTQASRIRVSNIAYNISSEATSGNINVAVYQGDTELGIVYNANVSLNIITHVPEMFEYGVSGNTTVAFTFDETIQAAAAFYSISIADGEGHYIETTPTISGNLGYTCGFMV